MNMIKYLFLASGLLFTLPSSAQSKAQVLQNNAVAAGEQDVKLEKAWHLFADALISNDLQTVKALSTDCIRCFVCPPGIDSSGTAFSIEQDTPYPTLIPFDNFLKIYGPFVFGSQTISRLKDTTKLDFIDNQFNFDRYTVPCISKSSGLKDPSLKEVLLLIVDPSPEFEGAQQAFAFIETKDGYKFCGYATIP